MSCYDKLVNIVFSKYQPIPEEVEVEMLCMVYFQPQKLRDLVQLSIYNDYTGCSTKLFTLFFEQFLGLLYNKDHYLGHFSTALSIGCSKLSKILKTEQYLTKL